MLNVDWKKTAELLSDVLRTGMLWEALAALLEGSTGNVSIRRRVVSHVEQG